MKLAGILAILLGVLFGVIAISSEVDDVNATSQHLQSGFDAIREGDNAYLDRSRHEAEEQQAAENHEWVGCAVCVIAGIALVAAGRKDSESEPESPPGLGLQG